MLVERECDEVHENETIMPLLSDSQDYEICLMNERLVDLTLIWKKICEGIGSCKVFTTLREMLRCNRQ